MTEAFSATVSGRLDGGVLIVTVDNPPVNAASTDMRTGLAKAIAHSAASADIDSVVITGAGKTFVGGAEFGLLSFDEQLGPSRLQLSLRQQAEADEGPEYGIQGLGRYQRLYRDPDTVSPVTPAERAMLDVCIATFTELAARCAPLVLAPPPPRYRSRAGKKRSN